MRELLDLQESLEAAIDVAPDVPEGYAVLGDLYAQHDNPRGELIALQMEPPSSSRRAREEVLLALDGLRPSVPELVRWRWGYVHALTFELVRYRAWEEHRDDWAQVLLARELAHPSCRFLRELVVDASPGDAALNFLSTSPPRHLRALWLICNELDLGRLGDGLKAIESLSLAAQLITAQPLALPKLSALSLPLDALPIDGLALVLESVRGTLRQLTLTSLEQTGEAALEPVLQLPWLHTLTLKVEQLDRSAVEALADSPLAATLTTLDVSRSGATEDTAQRLLQLTPRFTQLQTLAMGESPEP